MIHIQVPDELKPEIDESLIREAARLAIESRRGVDVEVSIVFVDDDRIRAMNESYRGFDEPTDVLSFPAGEIDPDSGAVYLGDVIISTDTANRQAVRHGHPFIDEIRLLVVHGLLHLFGYDHGSAEEKRAMWAEQSGVLAKLGIENIHIPDDPH